MNKKQELIDYVIGNEFITKPSLQDKFTKLLDEALAEQLILHGVVKSLKVEDTPTFYEYTQAKGYERIGNSNVYKKEGTYKDIETLKKQYQAEHYF